MYSIFTILVLVFIAYKISWLVSFYERSQKTVEVKEVERENKQKIGKKLKVLPIFKGLFFVYGLGTIGIEFPKNLIELVFKSWG